MYSIVDIEATGGAAKKSKITEIAIVNFDGQNIGEIFSTLINPEISIPYFIEKEFNELGWTFTEVIYVR